MTPQRELVHFKTLDGLMLAALFYSASKTGPAVIMTPGVGTRF